MRDPDAKKASMKGRTSETPLHRLIVWGVETVMSNSGLRYLATGAALFFLDLGVYILLHFGFGVAIMPAQLVSRTTGAAVGFVAHKFISFGVGTERQAFSATNQGLAYSIVMGANILASPLIVAFMVSLLGDRVILGKVVSDAIIITETYLVLRMIFRAEANVPAPAEVRSEPNPDT